ncbi:glycosyltransferase [Frondihabitans australicus]|uniref:Cellulose synthase/poly-beta-1,6-N-acetylglucosamine synthase-like glycosyltransferase n=1 Tax=Frondihabitans australicus TaxID=386892 RepID=A0A495IBT4_9MICO|nr:glycosyltransferase family 2 protein [Frondihabitans australicus]RKR73379.1 cellulose synthase/poly-beta-1,6-N-acetylglucosamine synthase-like glycosyltransferase [Frondihabitans australicus]
MSAPTTHSTTGLLTAGSAPHPILTPQPSDDGSYVPNRGGAGLGHAVAGGFHLPAWTPGEWIGYSALVVASILLTAVAISTLWWMLHAWRSRDNLDGTTFSATPLPARHRFTLLVPGRHEEDVLGQTLDRLAEQDHPDFEIIAIVGHDDPGTDRVAREAAARHPDLIRVVVDETSPKNKPKALNLALQTATGDIVGVFDAEDEVHPRLLSLVDSRFTETDADVVQGGVQLMNFRTSWWSLRNVLEYYFWFRSRLHFHAKSKFIPLGGNTVFVTKERLDWSEGWDASCLAEDCELGVRLSSAGAKVVVAYSPEVVTREETPGSFTSLLKQRTRWNQGFMQVLGKGEWKKLPTMKQRFYARYLLTMPFIQAITGLLIPVSVILMLTVKVPTGVALISFIPLAPTLVLLAVEFTGLAEFGRTYGEKVRARDYFRLVWGLIPYQIFLALAAVRAVYRQLRQQNGWEKTEHTGAHRDAPAQDATVTPIGAARPAPEPAFLMASGDER